MKVFKHLQLISIKNRTFNVPLNICLSNRMLADFYIPRLSSDMKIAVQKNHSDGQILHRSLVPSKKRCLCFLMFRGTISAKIMDSRL
mgnify:CR=1 FL=1